MGDDRTDQVTTGESDAGMMPRAHSGAQPQHLLVTLFGDYWFANLDHLPSAALVALLSEFNVSSTSARAALSRLSRRGLLESSKVGRRTYYGLTERAKQILRNGLGRILSFGAEADESWDGSWLVVIFSIPEDRRDVRHSLRTYLRWNGFAPLYDGTWVSPFGDPKALRQALAELDVETATILRSTPEHPEPGGRGHPLAAWDLEALRSLYTSFTEEFSPLLRDVEQGAVTIADALRARTRVMDTWRSFPGIDPQLPTVLLPDRWPRAEARRIFTGIYDGLGPLAELRFRQIVAAYAPGIAGGAHHFTTTHAGTC